MYNKVPNLILTLALLGLSTTSVVTRSTLHKIGLGLLTVGTIAASSKLQQNQLNKLAKLKDLVETLKSEHESKLLDLEQAHRQEVAGLASENYQTFKDKIQLINRKHAIEIEKLKAEHHAEIQATDQVIQQLRDQKKLLQGNIETLQKEFEAIRDDYAQRVATLDTERAHFDASKRDWELQQREVKLQAEQMLFQHSKQTEVQLSNEWEKLNAAKSKYNEIVTANKAEFQRVQNENKVLRERLGYNNGRYGTASVEGFLADRIESFYRRNQLPLTYVQATTQTQDRVTLQFTAKENQKDDIIKLQKELSSDVFGGSTVSVRRKDGYIYIDVPKVSSQVNIGAVEALPDTDYLTHFIQTSNHILVSGATGDGKTTLISNLLDLASTVLPGAKLIFLNPKPSAETKFYFRGQSIKADYLNLETPEGCTTPNCLEGLEYVHSVLLDRMAQTQRAIEQDKPQPKFNPFIIFVDEIPTLLATAKDLFRRVMEALSRLGREYNIIFVGAGQGASVAQWGLATRDQMQNFSRIYLKSVINTKMVFENELKFLPNLSQLEPQLTHYQANVKYWGLFIPQGNSLGTITQLPKPNYFVQTDPYCPNCNSTNIVKNGIRDGQQRMHCRDCNTSYSVKTAYSQCTNDTKDPVVDINRLGLTLETH